MDTLLTSEFTRDQWVAVNYHWYSTTDPYDTAQVTAKGSYYGVSASPWNFFDGKYGCPGDGYPGCRGAATTVIDAYRDSINARLAVDAPVKLTISGRLDATEGFVIVEAELLDTITPAVTDHVIRIAVQEDNIWYAPQSRFLRYVFRYTPTDEYITLNAVGDKARTARWFTYGLDWDPTQVSVVAFLQRAGDKEIDQGIYFDGTPALTVDPLPITANYLGGTPTIDGKFNPGEWSGANEKLVDLSYYVNFPFYVYTMNDDNFLYVCVDAVGDLDDSKSHYTGIYFDTDEDGVLTGGEEDAIETTYGGMVYYKTWSAGSWGTTIGTSGNGVPFTPGTHDEGGMIGASGYGPSDRESANHLVYEFKIPLALGALDATPGDKLRPYIYILGGNEESYWSPHVDWKDPASYGELTLASVSSIPSISIIGILVLTGLLGAGIIRKIRIS